MYIVPGLPEKHLELAKCYGISRDRIIPVSDWDELCAVARCKGVSAEEVAEYTDSTMGVCINDIPGGPDVWILLRYPVPIEEYQKAAGRLEQRGIKETANYAATSNPQWLLAFLLLHEVAHHKLKHGPAMDYGTKEIEADEWAHAELLRHYHDFSS